MRRVFPPGQLVLKVVFIAICAVVALGGHHPPSYAQTAQQIQSQYIPVITAKDAVQDTDIAALNKHVDNTDDNVKAQWQAISLLQSDISGMRGEERVIGAVLGLVASSSLILQWRKRPI
jgi:hypothetical protein